MEEFDDLNTVRGFNDLEVDISELPSLFFTEAEDIKSGLGNQILAVIEEPLLSDDLLFPSKFAPEQKAGIHIFDDYPEDAPTLKFKKGLF